MARRTVAVVGGGCAGVLVATHLLRCTDDIVALVEPGALGGGVAYGAAEPWHLLNSRAGAMSAHPDDPRHLVAWARARGVAATADAFLPRPLYGEYLAAVLETAATGHPGRLRVHRARAVGVRAGGRGTRVRLDDGRDVSAAHAVLAIGGPSGGRPVPVPDDLGVADPWRPGALAGLPAGPILLLGTGLTAVDVALTLAAGGRGPIEAVSRRGLLPQPHATAHGGPAAVLPEPGAGLRALLRAVRVAARSAGDWRCVVDGLRPRLDVLWQGLDAREQDRFLRHVARHWEVHRHRMAPQVARRIDLLRAAGALTVRAAGVRSLVGERGGLTVAFTDGTTRRYAAVVNCAGPGLLPAAAGPLLRDLLDARLATVGPHRLGLDVDADGRLLRPGGVPQPRLWAVGPLRRGRLWETTAVPEIRAQAVRLAEALAPAAAWTGRAA